MSAPPQVERDADGGDPDEGEQRGFDEKSCEGSFVADNPMRKILSV